MKNSILIIEDNDMMRKYLTKLFEKEYHIEAKASAEEAFAWLDDNNQPGLIISDFRTLWHHRI